MKLKGKFIEEGDVLLLSDGRMARIASGLHTTDSKGNDIGNPYFMLQFIDQSGETFQEDDGTVDLERNLGQTDEVVASFYAARGIHLRMNDAKLFG